MNHPSISRPGKIPRIHARRFRQILAGVLLTGFGGILSAAVDPETAPLRPDGHSTPVDAGIPHYRPVPPLKGDLYIGGGMPCPIIDQWVGIFSRAHPSVRVHTAVYAGASAMGQLIEGGMQVCLLTREFLPSELEFMRMKIRVPEQFGVAVAGGGYSSEPLGGVPSQVILVHPSNPIKGLTLPQLDAIFSKTRKRGYPEDITTWGQLGLTGDWADKPIHVYHARMPDGVPNFFRMRVMLGGEFKDTNLSLYDNPGIVGKDPYAICMGKQGPGHRLEKRDPTSRTVPLAETEAGPYLSGTYEEVLNRSYPLSRLIYLFVRTPPGVKVDPLAKEFMHVALSYEGQWEVARTLFMPLPASVVNQELAKIK